MKRYFLIIGAVAVSAAFSQQAQRDTAEVTDTLSLDPLRGNNYIELTIEEDVFKQKGSKEKPRDNQYYFRVYRDIRYTPVNYFGDNLAEYVYEVPEAYELMKSYRNCKAAFAGMFYGGLGISLIGAVATLLRDEGEGISPVLFVGLGTVSLSWIPWYVSHEKVPEAVGVFNDQINQRDQKTGESKP